MAKKVEKEMSFWDHLDALRFLLFRTLGVWLALSVFFFCFKDFLFGTIILAPTKPDFFVYKWLGLNVSLSLINTDVTAQFMTHIKISFIAAVIVAVPYLIFELWLFIKPALYQKEKKAIRGAFAFASVLFYLGMTVGYVMVLPLMVNFFAKYQVSGEVTNMFNLSSYISLFSTMVLLFGLVFEFPSVIAVLSRMGIIYRSQMLKSWRYAVAGIVVVAAAITPTGDPFSLAIVSLPLFLLYIFSIMLCRKEVPSIDEDDEVEETEE